jgi:hypothetical protein
MTIRFGEQIGAIVCGGRTYGEPCGDVLVNRRRYPFNPNWLEERSRMFRVLDRAVERLGLEFIVQGGQTGADYCAWLWAEDRRFPCGNFAADWDRYGGRAGPIRNLEMLDTAKPKYVIALPGGRGTNNMVFLAERVGVTVYRIPTSKGMENEASRHQNTLLN